MIVEELESKRMTDDGKARKERIVEKIPIEGNRTKLVLCVSFRVPKLWFTNCTINNWRSSHSFWNVLSR